jgi:hypothetical protein
LRHPVIWGGYTSLSEAERDRVLNRELPYLNRLAKLLYDRFLRKCQARRQWRDERMLERALTEIATVTPNTRPYPADTWDQACLQCLGQREGEDLYHESLSYGLIERDQGTSWRWAHPFLSEFFARGSGND